MPGKKRKFYNQQAGSRKKQKQGSDNKPWNINLRKNKSIILCSVVHHKEGIAQMDVSDKLNQLAIDYLKSKNLVIFEEKESKNENNDKTKNEKECNVDKNSMDKSNENENENETGKDEPKKECNETNEKNEKTEENEKGNEKDKNEKRASNEKDEKDDKSNSNEKKTDNNNEEEEDFDITAEMKENLKSQNEKKSNNEKDNDKDNTNDNTKEKTNEKTNEKANDSKFLSIEDEIERECFENKKNRKVQWIRAPNGLIMLHIMDDRINTVDFINYVFEQSYPNKPDLSPFVYRLYPLETTCMPNHNDIVNMCKKLIEKYFVNDIIPYNTTYYIQYKNRSNKHLDRSKLVQEIASHISKEHYTVKIGDDAQTVILLQTCLNMAGASIFTNGTYSKYKEFVLSKFDE